MNSYYIEKLFQATYETIYLTIISTIFVAFFGLIIGVFMFSTNNHNLLENKTIYRIISSIVNIIRSIPFIILIILLLPITKILVGTILGPNAALPALIIGIVPYYSKFVESSLKEINQGVIEAAKAHGANNFQIITRVLIPEGMPSLISNLTNVAISILGYTAMAGVIGAGGLGNLAFIEGFQRNNQTITIITTLIILILVFIIQIIGDFIVKKVDKR